MLLEVPLELVSTTYDRLVFLRKPSFVGEGYTITLPLMKSPQISAFWRRTSSICSGVMP